MLYYFRLILYSILSVMTDDVSKSGGTPIIFDGWHSISFSLLWNRVRRGFQLIANLALFLQRQALARKCGPYYPP